MKKKKFDLITPLRLLPLIIVLVTLCCVYLRSSQSMPAGLYPNVLAGQFRQGGGEWLPLDEHTTISALDGDVILQGRFRIPIPQGTPVHFYLDHINAVISVNGETVADSTLETSSVRCGTLWQSFLSPGITGDDIIEIRLHNPHFFGNRSAYDSFLSSLYCATDNDMNGLLTKQNLLSVCAGAAIIVVALMILGISLAACVLKNDQGSKLMHLGLMLLASGIYILTDTSNITLQNALLVFSTYLRGISLMVAVYEVCIYIRYDLSGRFCWIVNTVAIAEGVLLVLTAAVPFFTYISLYDSMLIWYAAQFLLCPVMAIYCLYEIIGRRSVHKSMLISCILLSISFSAELFNAAFFQLYPEGALTKSLLFGLFLFHLVPGLNGIPGGFQAQHRAQQLEDELQNSQTALAMSQIRSHFIFNILNAISGMCKYDPEMADETVVRFARYLRTNIDIMQQVKVVTFDAAVQHLEDYVALQQIRFGDKVRFRQELRVDGFPIPSLVLQPIVENAIKHGLTPKPEGGTIFLKTWCDRKNFYILIEDDGVGFDPSAVKETRENGLGLGNVRYRLKNIMKGEMDIRSTPGVGTSVTLTIPRKESFRCISST